MRYLVDLEKDGKVYMLDNASNSKKNILEFAKNAGYTVKKIVPSKEHHRCKYCNNIVPGKYDDLLCDDCRETFGHTLYSEL